MERMISEEALKDIDPFFLVLFGVGFLLLLLIPFLKKRSKRGTGRFATIFEIMRPFGNWTKWPLNALGSILVYLLLLLMSAAALFIHQGVAPFKQGLKLAAVAIALWVVAAVFYRFLSTAFFIRVNSWPFGERGLLGMRVELTLSEKDRYEHILVEGRAGAGKTSGFMIPGLLKDAEGKCSVVALDVKAPEIYDTVAGYWNKHGKKVILIDPYHKEGIGFEPLAASIGGVALARLEQMVYGKPNTRADEQSKYFDDQERRLFRLYCTLVQTFTDPKQVNLPILYQLGVRGIKVLEEAVRYCRNEKVQEEFQLFSESKHRLPELLAGMLNKLDFLSDPEISAAFSRSDLDLEILFREPTLLIIASPQSNPKARLAAAVVLRALMLKVYERPNRKEGEGLPLFLYLDEFYNIYLPDMPDFVVTARSARVGVATFYQTDEQLDQYERHEKASLQANRKFEVYFQGLPIKKCKELSERIGKTLIKVKERSRSFLRGNQVRITEREADLLSPDDIQNLADHKALCFVAGVRPFLVNRLMAHKTRRYKRKLNFPPAAYRPTPEPLIAPAFRDLPEPPATGPGAPPAGWPKPPEETGQLYQF